MVDRGSCEILNQHKEEWIGVSGPNVHVLAFTYGVIIDRVSVATFEELGSKAFINGLKAPNLHLLGPRTIDRVHWLQKLRRNRVFLSLVVEFTNAADDNAVIAQGDSI